MVRILKNVRNRAVRESLLSSGPAPSYFLEGLLYNLPNGQFVGSYAGSFVNLLNWMLTCNSDDLVCANERYYLVRDGAHNCWAWDDFDRFRRVLLDVWQGW